MFVKRRAAMLFGALLSSASLIAAQATTATIIGRTLFSLVFPFFLLPVTIEKFSLQSLLILVIVIGIESYTVHRMLKKSCFFVVPRMIAINLIEVIVQGLVFAILTMLLWVVYLIKYSSILADKSDSFVVSFKTLMSNPEVFNQFVLWPLAVYGFVAALVLFYVRFATACKVFAWFDPSVDRVQLKKAILFANGLSYAFLFIELQLSMIKALKPYLG